MQTAIVYSYDRDTGEYRGEAVAHENPRRPGSYLLPAFSTETAPPGTGEHEAAVYRDGAWSVVPDWRGHEYWLADGSRHEITELGVEPPAGALSEPPPPTAERLCAYVNGVRDQVEQGGFAYNGWRFDSDAVSVARINGAALAAQAALSAGEPFQIEWTDADNVSRPLDAAQMLALQRALVAHADACHQLARQLKAQVEAGTITTEAEIDAAAWPTP